MDFDGLNGLEYERIGPLRRSLKVGVTNPLINWVLPARFLRWLLRWSKSEMAAASWADPGGWKSMLFSYREDQFPQIADRLLRKFGSMPMALRNRKRLVVEVFNRLIRARGGERTNIVALGAGPGMNTLEAIERATRSAEPGCPPPDCHAYLIDLNPDSFEFGRKLAEEKGLADRVSYIQGDVTHYGELCDAQPHIVEMIGICEYLDDAVIESIAEAIGRVMPSGCYLIANSLSPRHGTDRFFRRVFDLHMHHRTPSRILALLSAANVDLLHLAAEPLGVYDVLILRKR